MGKPPLKTSYKTISPSKKETAMILDPTLSDRARGLEAQESVALMRCLLVASQTETSTSSEEGLSSLGPEREVGGRQVAMYDVLEPSLDAERRFDAKEDEEGEGEKQRGGHPTLKARGANGARGVAADCFITDWLSHRATVPFEWLVRTRDPSGERLI